MVTLTKDAIEALQLLMWDLKAEAANVEESATYDLLANPLNDSGDSLGWYVLDVRARRFHLVEDDT